MNLTKRNLLKFVLFLIPVIIAAYLLGNTGLPTASASGAVELSEVNIQTRYIYGETLTIPAATLMQGSEEKPAEAILYTPSGNAIKVSSIKLEEEGEWTIEYRAIFDGITVKQSKKFTVVKKLYQTTGKSTAYFGTQERAPNEYGIVVSLNNGDKFLYNKPLSFNDGVNELFSLFATPIEERWCDACYVFVRFTDIYDENNFITVQMRCDNAEWCNYMVYFAAGSSKQIVSGWGGGDLKLELYRGSWGNAKGRSLYGYDIPSKLTASLNYDNKEVRTINNDLVIDLDDPAVFDNLWKGFSADKAYMSIYASQYIKPSFNFVISSIMDEDLSGTVNDDTTAPVLTIKDDNGIIPTGIAGAPYKLFDTEIYDENEEVLTASRRVYGNYYSQTRYELEVTDGSFLPTRAGIYYIEYIVADKFGNTSRELIPVTVLSERTEAFTVEVTADGDASGVAGQPVSVSGCDIEGNIGSIGVTVTAELAGKASYEIDKNGQFIPEYAGEYTIKYVAKDYVGTAQDTYTFTVANGTAPVIKGEAEFPDFIIGNVYYDLPELVAYDYSSGNPVKTAITVTSDSSKFEISGNKFKADTDGMIKIKYTATVGSASVVKEYDVRVVAVGFGRSLDYSKYFYGENITATLTDEYTELKATQDAEATLIKTFGASCSMIFDIDSTKNNLAGVDIFLTDSENADQVVKLSFDKPEDASQRAQSLFSVNNGEKLLVNGSFFGESNKTLSFDYNDITQKIIVSEIFNSSAVFELSGAEFDGFDSKNVKITVKLRGVTGEAAIRVMSVCGHPFISMPIDTVPPVIRIVEPILKQYSIDSVVKLAWVVANDAIDPNVEFKMTMKTPSEEIMTSQDGILLSDVEVKRYDVKLTEYGLYRVTLSAKDTAGRTRTYSYEMTVVDMESPVIIFLDSVPTEVQVGETVAVPTYVVRDNFSDNITVYTYLRIPDGTMIKLNNDSFKGLTAGNYIIKFMVMDENGNVAMKNFSVDVK